MLGRNGFAAFQAGETLDGFAGFLLSEAQVVERLQIEPERRGLVSTSSFRATECLARHLPIWSPATILRK